MYICTSVSVDYLFTNHLHDQAPGNEWPVTICNNISDQDAHVTILILALTLLPVLLVCMQCHWLFPPQSGFVILMYYFDKSKNSFIHWFCVYRIYARIWSWLQGFGCSSLHSRQVVILVSYKRVGVLCCCPLSSQVAQEWLFLHTFTNHRRLTFKDNIGHLVYMA